MYQRIVVGAGPSQAAESAVAEAVELANALGAELHLVLAFDRYRDRAHPESLPATTEAEDHLARLGTGATGPLHRHAISGDPADAILDTARQVGATSSSSGTRACEVSPA